MCAAKAASIASRYLGQAAPRSAANAAYASRTKAAANFRLVGLASRTTTSGDAWGAPGRSSLRSPFCGSDGSVASLVVELETRPTNSCPGITPVSAQAGRAPVTPELGSAAGALQVAHADATASTLTSASPAPAEGTGICSSR